MPSYFSAVQQACPNLQAALEDVWLQPGAFPGADDRMPFAEFLNSPANKAGISSLITPGRGKIRTVEVIYDKRRLENSVQSNQANPKCTASDVYGNELETYSLDTDVNLQANETIGLSDFEAVCGDNASIFNKKVALMIDVLDRAVATQQTTQAVALTGGWGASVTVNGSDQLVINTLIAGTQNPAPYAWINLRNALDDSGFGSDVFVAGGQTMRQYFQFLQAGCCADYGLDLGEIMAQYGYAFAYDKRLQTALGSVNEFMVLQPRALQVLNFSRADGKAAMGEIWNAGSDYFYTAIRSPRLGLVYDLTAKDDCGTLALNLTYTGKVIGLPTDMFATGDEYDGVTYAVQGLVTNS